MDNPTKKGSRIIGGIIIALIILFLTIYYFFRQSTEFSPTNVTNILLTSLQIIVLLLALILFFVLGRNLIKLYLERKRKIAGSHFKTKLVIFFTALSFIPTLLLFLFTSDLITRNIEQWFKPDINKILDDAKTVADGFYVTTSELTLHYAQQLSREIRRQNLVAPENRAKLEELIRSKLSEYRLDEIGIFLEEEELFAYYNPNLPFQDYQELKANLIKRAHLGEPISDIKPMGTGEFVRRGVSVNLPNIGNVLVTTGKFLPQNYAQKINTLSAFVQRYRGRYQKDLAKTSYLMILIFVTMLIVFAATWIGFHIAKSITVPIEKLVQATKEVSKGNLSVKVEDPASDEIGTLIESFNQMISDLKTSQENIAQKTAEQAARKQYIETILNAINTGVIALDAQGSITTINPSARDMLALSGKNVTGQHYKDILSHDRYRDFLKNIDAAMKSKYRLADKEIQLVLNGQQTTIALTLTPLKQPDQDFSGMIVVLDDLSQLIKAQRMAAWKEVAQRVAHEIKNPLTPIQLNAERIIKNLKKAEPGGSDIIDQGARVIIQEAQTIKSLVDEFSDFARLPKINLQPASVHDIIGQVVTMFRGIFADVQFDMALSPDVPASLQLDPEQMKRVFINLIDNAIDAMNKKGKIFIHTFYDREANQVRIEVSDTGPGILIDDKDKLFLPHFSTKKKGTGLGLAIVSQIIKEHNGAVQVHNNRPGGAKFTLQLPA
ncbi:MAG: ATP-binding protein [Candidatus Aminicenantes bacterium]|nr:ATP-binding protein [Candidatus Aminicenantes bacterium]